MFDSSSKINEAKWLFCGQKTISYASGIEDVFTHAEHHLDVKASLFLLDEVFLPTLKSDVFQSIKCNANCNITVKSLRCVLQFTKSNH